MLFDNAEDMLDLEYEVVYEKINWSHADIEWAQVMRFHRVWTFFKWVGWQYAYKALHDVDLNSRVASRYVVFSP